MKKIFTLSSVALLLTFFLTSCVKQDVNAVDEGYWLSKERGEVVYSSPDCSYYVVDTYNGYAVIRSFSFMPYEGDVLYGDFSHYGLKDIYNRNEGIIIRAEIKDYWLTYNGAQDALDFYCY